MNAVELIDNHDGTFSLRVYDLIVCTGTLEECRRRESEEGCRG